MVNRRATSWPTALGAVFSLGSATVHLLVAPEHFEEWWGYGMFFLAVGAAQAAYGTLLIFNPSRQLFLLGILSNLAVIALYVFTRTVGIPLFGPAAGTTEAVGPIDLASKVVEMVLVLTLISMLVRVDTGSRLHIDPGRLLAR